MSDGVEKSAIFLMTLGETEAAEVLKYLEPKEVQKISAAMVTIKNLTREQIGMVFHDFLISASSKTSIGMDSNDYIRSMLTKALGDDKAASLLDRIMHNSDTSGIESLKWMDPGAVAEMIGNEHPQIIATILVHLEPDQSASILKMLTDRTRNDVLLRISTLDGVQPLALRELNDVLSRLMSGSNTSKKNLQGGVEAAAEILNYMGGAMEAEIIENVRSHDPDLAQKIEDKMFVFENVLEIDDRGIQLILR
ncbi:MAG: flagellar motor switch protein FliG, partial [Gallionella sp.]